MKQEEANELAKENLSVLHESLKLGQSDRLRAYLRAISYFKDYSFRNTIMIVSQRPTATAVAGFHTWRKLGRFVSKGQTGIRIFAPIIKKQESGDADQNSVKGFRLAHVFDIEQTEGDSMPKLAEPQTGTAEYRDKLLAVIEDHGIEVQFDASDLREGVFGVSAGKVIKIRPGMDSMTEFHTIVHEFAHELLHREECKAPENKKRIETEAESIAFSVSHACGVQCLDHVCDYIGTFGGCANTFEASMARIFETSAYIIGKLKD
ncbi:ArdC family protein [Rhodopirellula europaea]|uniref:ArdC family protein n=1 Tax=Rhodopirellula europaea TaxID=1263866 RepID=UPI0030EE9742